jgi:hypothetical protein
MSFASMAGHKPIHSAKMYYMVEQICTVKLRKYKNSVKISFYLLFCIEYSCTFDILEIWAHVYLIPNVCYVLESVTTRTFVHCVLIYNNILSKLTYKALGKYNRN